jgi:hypothetical protein
MRRFGCLFGEVCPQPNVVGVELRSVLCKLHVVGVRFFDQIGNLCNEFLHQTDGLLDLGSFEFNCNLDRAADLTDLSCQPIGCDFAALCGEIKFKMQFHSFFLSGHVAL